MNNDIIARPDDALAHAFMNKKTSQNGTNC